MNRHQPVLPEDIKNATNKFFELSERCQKMLEDQDISEKAKEFVSTKMQKPWSNLFDCLKKIRKKKDAFSEFNQNAREIVALIQMAESCKRGRHSYEKMKALSDKANAGDKSAREKFIKSFEGFLEQYDFVTMQSPENTAKRMGE